MGRTMKTLLIVAVAAVAAWLLMKRRNGSATPVVIDATPASTASDTSTADGVIDAINATSAEKYAMKQVVKLVRKSESWYKAEQANAIGQGHTMAQQLAIAAAYQLYANNYAQYGVKLTYERYNQLYAEIEGLG